MDFFTAFRYAKAGFHIRRSTWLEDVETPLAGQSNKRVTAWLAYAAGAWLYRPTDGTADRVVEADDVEILDMQAIDWTLADAEQNPQMPPTEEPDSGPALPPIPPVLPPDSNTVGGVSDGGAIPGGGGGDGSGDGGNGGGSPGGGAPGGPGGPGGGGKPGGNRPQRSNPSLTLTVTRTSDEPCAALQENGTPNPNPVTDSFTADMALSDPGDTKPGEVWFLSLTAGGKVRYSGTIAAGGNQSANFSLTGAPATKFPAMARAYLSGTGLQASDSKNAYIRPDCTNAPVIFNFECLGLVATEFTRSAGENVDHWTINVIYSGSPSGLTFAWTIDSLDAGSGGSIDFTNDGNNSYTHAFEVTVTNDFGSDTMSGGIIVTGPP